MDWKEDVGIQNDLLEDLEVFDTCEDYPKDAIYKISTGLREARKWLNDEQK